MLNVILDLPALEVNPQTLEQRIAQARWNARNTIAWITLPSVAARYQLLDVAYLVSMFNLCIDSISPAEAIADIELLIEYVRLATVGQVSNG